MNWKTRSIVCLVFLLCLPLNSRADPTDFQPRPIPMGVSISTSPTPPFITAGTAGLLVHSLADPNSKFILSNNHVIGAVGPTLCPGSAESFETWVIQPATLDLGYDPGQDPDFFVGFTAYMAPIQFGPTGTNLVDAAIATTLPSLASNEILGIGRPTPKLALPRPGMKVIKSGRTTGVTTGVIESVNTTLTVSYGICGRARFVQQVVVASEDFSDSGDSGSIILDNDSLRPVGLLFAGSSNTTVLNNILYVYLLLGVFVD